MGRVKKINRLKDKKTKRRKDGEVGRFKMMSDECGKRLKVGGREKTAGGIQGLLTKNFRIRSSFGGFNKK